METFFREDRDITMLQLTYDSSTCERLQNEMGFHVTDKVTDFYRDGVENRFFKYVKIQIKQKVIQALKGVLRTFRFLVLVQISGSNTLMNSNWLGLTEH